MARLLTSSDEDVAYAASRLRDGLLVGFPTETVYGLGADALNAAAAARVFEVKGRPSTDPLIVHVVDYEAAFLRLWNADELTLQSARLLAKALWPGPLTLVARAAACVPDIVCGGSGFVGVRVPDHPVAQRLIRVSGCCVAAPSANLFGHVSPTTARHVMDDLAARDDSLTVVDGGQCHIGIESTVVKFISGRHLEVVRRGRYTANDVLAAFVAAGVTDATVVVRDTRSKYLKKDHSEAMDAPGQLLTHYAPHVPTFLLTPASIRGVVDAMAQGTAHSWELVLPSGAAVPAAKVLLIDFCNLLAQLSNKTAGASTDTVLAQTSLSTTGDEEEACRAIFDALRWSETIAGAEALCVPLITEFYASQLAAEAAGLGDAAGAATQGGSIATAAGSTKGVELLEAVEDRLFRAASGRMAVLRPVRLSA